MATAKKGRWQRFAALKEGEEGPAATKKKDVESHRLECIRKQVEYYLSDRNLAGDDFFRERLLQDGFVPDTLLLQCGRIQKLEATRESLVEALQASEALQVQANPDGVYHVSRVEPYQPEAAASQEGAGPKAHQQMAEVVRGGPTYDHSSPCGYYLAGFCRYGARCGLQHSAAYAEAVRRQWLHPADPSCQDELRARAEEVMSEEMIRSENLFPRVFAKQLSTARDLRVQQSLRYILVLDLEGKDEIIEFPVLVFDTVSGQEVGRFQRYVRPKYLFAHETINAESPAILFDQVLTEFDGWLKTTLGFGLEAVGPTSQSLFLTCGDFDCKHVHRQCQISGIAVPSGFSQWVNIKRTYAEHYGREFRGMKSMLAQLRLLDKQGNVKTGFHHLGMHDVENITRCLLHLLDIGVQIRANGTWTPKAHGFGRPAR
mmetsp:Transcript_60215/g.111632  ORF Transcript_60215/g.111632 Transcript_60215/m.111632 type:complete len:430 (-) Transcript_60215:99-1388(-)